MSLLLNSFEPDRIYLGLQEVRYVYLGQVLIWPTGEIDSCLPDTLVDGAGNIVSAVYQDYAARFNAEDVLVWRFGPGYKCYHPVPETIPLLGQWASTDEDGIAGPGNHESVAADSAGWPQAWYGNQGPLLYLPDSAGSIPEVTIFTDTFTEGTSVLLENHVPDSGVGYNKFVIGTDCSATVDAATGQMHANVANHGQTSGVIYVTTPAQSMVNYSVEINNTNKPDADVPYILLLHFIDIDNYYYATLYPIQGWMEIGKKIDGVYTSLAAKIMPIDTGDVMRFSIFSSTLRLYQNGTVRLTVADTSLPAAGFAGIGLGGFIDQYGAVTLRQEMTFDNFSVIVGGSSNDPGIAAAVGGATYATNWPELMLLNVFDFNVRLTHGENNYNFAPYWVAANPDTFILESDIPDLSRPVGVARCKTNSHTSSTVIFKDGRVAFSGITVATQYKTYISETLPSLQLPAGKVPTAACTTMNNEFILVTVWDTATEQGQMAIIAVEGNPLGNASITPAYIGDDWLWGIPNWPFIKNYKLLGFVDLPMQAPMSINATSDTLLWTGRGSSTNWHLDLSTQLERDWWRIRNGPGYKRVATAGYAIVASRSENLVCFIDLQPLFQYYQSMYFTTQNNHTQTTNVGMAANQWPHAFSHAPQQMPVVVSTINIPKPTAVVAGCGTLYGNNFDLLSRDCNDGILQAPPPDYVPPDFRTYTGGFGFIDVSGAVSLSKANPQTGVASLHIHPTDAEECYAGLRQTSAQAGHCPIRVFFGFYVEQLPATGSQKFLDATLVHMWVDSAGFITARDENGRVKTTALHPISTGQYYNLDIYIGFPRVSVSMTIDGVFELEAAWSLGAEAVDTISTIYLCSVGGNIVDWYYDNIGYDSFGPGYQEVDGLFKQRAFIATQDDGLLMYDVGNLNIETADAKTTPVLKATIDVGANPCSIFNEYIGPGYRFDMFVLARGDNTIYQVNGNAGLEVMEYGGVEISYGGVDIAYGLFEESITSSFRDGRLVDPCHISGAIYRQHQSDETPVFGSLHIADFNGKAMRNYIRWIEAFAPKPTDPDWYYGTSNEIPGKPFIYSQGEII